MREARATEAVAGVVYYCITKDIGASRVILQQLVEL